MVHEVSLLQRNQFDATEQSKSNGLSPQIGQAEQESPLGRPAASPHASAELAAPLMSYFAEDSRAGPSKAGIAEAAHIVQQRERAQAAGDESADDARERYAEADEKKQDDQGSDKDKQPNKGVKVEGMQIDRHDEPSFEMVSDDENA